MISDIIKKSKPYEGCLASFDKADIILFGAGFDGTSSYRPGSRFAPLSIRSETYYAQEDYSPYFNQDLTDKAIHDLGDVEIVFGNTSRTLERIEAVSRHIVNAGKIPVTIGGEHLITYPAIKPVVQKYPDLRVVQLDAHLDLMDELFGDKYSHGSVMRRVSELFSESGRIYQVGIRSGSREEFTFAEKHTHLFKFDTLEFVKRLGDLKKKPIYLTIDIDVFDPSLIPGTGTPEAGGIFFQQYIELLMKMKDMNIVGADIVELAPQIDPTNVSTIVASKILRELLMIL
jgi:agmatinase